MPTAVDGALCEVISVPHGGLCGETEDLVKIATFPVPLLLTAVYFSLPLEIRGFSRHTDFCGLAIRGPGAFENFYAN